jgi:hypothetical protein
MTAMVTRRTVRRLAGAALLGALVLAPATPAFAGFHESGSPQAGARVTAGHPGGAGGTSALAAAAVAPAGGRPTPAAFRCGFYVDANGKAWYGHCDAPPRTDVVIHVTDWNGDYDMCVKPGLTLLGTFPPVVGAAYTGRLCSAG